MWLPIIPGFPASALSLVSRDCRVRRLSLDSEGWDGGEGGPGKDAILVLERVLPEAVFQGGIH